jgi:uncharacterized protein (DUF983 family)
MKPRTRVEYPAAPLSATVLRFRCPHCGRGAVLTGLLSMHERCAVCGFVFKRGNPAYFSGAIFINYLLGAGGAIGAFLIVLVATWPNVPWNTLAYAGPVGAIVIIVAFYPVSKMILLAIDVRMRPITEDELIGGTRPTGDAVS